MILIEYIRKLFPSMYWSAGFIAFAVAAIGLSAVLYLLPSFSSMHW